MQQDEIVDLSTIKPSQPDRLRLAILPAFRTAADNPHPHVPYGRSKYMTCLVKPSWIG